MPRFRVLLAALIVGGGVSLVTAPGAHALSCAVADEVVAHADRVFTGTVESVEGNLARVAVREDRGPVEVPDHVTVSLQMEGWWSHGGPRHSDDVWLFALGKGPGGAELDGVNPCNAWNEGGEYGYPEVDDPSATLTPATPATPPTEVPDEAWNPETNPDMARLAQRSGEADPSHSASTLALSASGGVALGLAALGGIGLRRRAR